MGTRSNTIYYIIILLFRGNQKHLLRQFLTKGEKSAILSLRKCPANYVIASTNKAILRDCHACLRQARNDNGTNSAIVRSKASKPKPKVKQRGSNLTLIFDNLAMTEKKGKGKNYASD